MLVDTGSVGTFLNWNGISDLGISRNDDQFLQRITNPVGFLGSDNIVMKVTHQGDINSTLNFATQRRQPQQSQSQERPSTSSIPSNLLPGMSLAGDKHLRMEIGNLAILEILKQYKVGAILGFDAFLRATCVRFVFEKSKEEILIYQ